MEEAGGPQGEAEDVHSDCCLANNYMPNRALLARNFVPTACTKQICDSNLVKLDYSYLACQLLGFGYIRTPSFQVQVTEDGMRHHVHCTSSHVPHRQP